MSAFRHAWVPLLHWASPPVQVGIALIIALLLVTKVLTRLINLAGTGLREGWTPLLELLTYPEFLLTSGLRSNGYGPVPGTYAYGRVLGAFQASGTALGQWLATLWSRRRPRFPRKSALLVIALLAACWYGAPKVTATGLKSVLADVNNDDTQVSTWIATGQWDPDPFAACSDGMNSASGQ